MCILVVPSQYPCMLRLHCSVSELEECWSVIASDVFQQEHCVLLTNSAETRRMSGILVVPVDRGYIMGVAASSYGSMMLLAVSMSSIVCRGIVVGGYPQC